MISLPPNNFQANLELDGQQRILYDELHQMDPSLARMYHGALIVLKSENPDRFALSAHGIRELMEKLPERDGIKSLSDSLKSQANNLYECWKRTKNNTACYKTDKWDGPMDIHLIKFLHECAAFFDWVTKFLPQRKTQVAQVLRKFDGSSVPMPAELEKKNVDIWDKINDFFKFVSHHRKNTNHEEFQNFLSELESFLLTRFHPQTFADFDALDEIIKEGEG